MATNKMRPIHPGEILREEFLEHTNDHSNHRTKRTTRICRRVDSLHGLADRGIVRREFIDTLLKQHLPAHPRYYGELVWIMTMLEQWLQTRAPNHRAN